ncbi:ribonuclease H-like domain-containing protein [Tanacetum coccineum]
MCDKKNKVLFTDTECLVLSPDFKLPDEYQILLKVPRYSFNLENIIPLGGLACLIAKATTDESNKWHRRLGQVNFKNLNRLVKGNLLVRPIITDDFSRFSWTFFLRTKDETSAILKDFIRQIENQLNQKVKTIRCDNGTEFKNRDINEFYGLKGIKREYSNARTPSLTCVQEEWEAEEEKNKLAEEQATNEALINNIDDVKARIEADRILAEKLQEQEREQFSIEERAKFFHDTIAAQRKFLAQQRSQAIRNKPPTKNQFRNQMITYIKHVGNYKHADLKSKKFEHIQALYEKINDKCRLHISIYA